MRKYADFPSDVKTEPTDEKRRDSHGGEVEYITQVREYKLITPLFGGGVDPQQADPLTVIRASEIRGHLRFWWRATRGGQFGGDLAKMKAAEDALWGAASTKAQERPSLVQVSVEPLSKPEPFDPIDRYGHPAPHVGHPRSRHSYVAFPLNESAGKVQVNIQFRLDLRYPHSNNVIEELKKTLWAWETFGGIGGRTRRGFGAIAPINTEELLTVKDTCNALLSLISDCTKQGEWHSDVPHLSSESWRLVFIRPDDDNEWQTRLKYHNQDETLSMWDMLIQKLREFRQDRPQHGNRPGRTRWPEADALRDYTTMKAHYTDVDGRLHDHRRPSVALNGSPIRVFPRAVFGLPLIFQFKDNYRALVRDARKYADRGRTPTQPRDPDPDPVTIEGKTFRRWASPLILRPLQCKDGVLGIVLVLAQLEMRASDLRLVGIPNTSPDIALTQHQAQQVSILQGQTDVIRAFLQYIERKDQ